MIGPKYIVLTAAALLSSACIVSPVPYQTAGPQGIRVRVRSDVVCPPVRSCTTLPVPETYDGTLIFVDADTLTMHVLGETYVAMPVWSITKVEVYRGQKTSAGSTAKGAGAGAAVGALLGALTGVATEAIFGGIWGDRDYGTAAAAGAIYGAFEGAAAGAVIGATKGAAVWQETTVFQLRQELCHCRIPVTTTEDGSDR